VRWTWVRGMTPIRAIGDSPSPGELHPCPQEAGPDHSPAWLLRTWVRQFWLARYRRFRGRRDERGSIGSSTISSSGRTAGGALGRSGCTGVTASGGVEDEFPPRRRRTRKRAARLHSFVHSSLPDPSAFMLYAILSHDLRTSSRVSSPRDVI
jgi:hypothetical protein